MKMSETAGRVSTWLGAILLVGAASVSCDSSGGGESSGDEQQAQAVESNEKGGSAEKGDDKKQGAAKKEAADKNDSEKEGSAPEKATVGKKAPNFTLKDASGEKHTLKDYRGDVVVLEWTSWDCPYVKRHYKAGTMGSTIDEVGGENFTWLAVDSTNYNTVEKTKKWKNKHDIEFPILMDKDGTVGKMYGAKTTPHMYVIDKKGVLRYKGAIDDAPQGEKDDPTNYVQQAVASLKNGEDVEPKTTDPYGCSVKYPDAKK